MKHFFSALLTSFFFITIISGQEAAVEKGIKSINYDVIQSQLGFLSSDWMEGREAGEKGEFIASDYIASMLRLYGVKPMGDYPASSLGSRPESEKKRSYFQNIILLKTEPGDKLVMRIKTVSGDLTKTTDLEYNVDFTFWPQDQTVEINAPVVFAGYGYIDDSVRYNDLIKTDVRGKFILKLSGYPKFVKVPDDRQSKASLRSKMEARYKSMGAIGILEFDPDQDVVGKPASRDFMDLSPSESAARQRWPHSRYSIPGSNFPDNIIRIELSAKAANEILNGSGIKVSDYITAADSKKPFAFPSLKNKAICFRSSVNTSQVAVRNVIGIIEGKNPDKYVLLGAHYDHIGMDHGFIWNGADDNGSGTVGVMTIAKTIEEMDEKPEKSIIVALWTAEEEGLLGSRYWISNLDFPVSDILVNMNFDMISRYISDDEPKKVAMTYTASFPWFRDLTAGNVEKYRIDLDVDYQPSDDPPGGTDHRSFVRAGIPIIRFKPGHREEYHTPYDETGTLNWDIMRKIIQIGYADIWDLANREW